MYNGVIFWIFFSFLCRFCIQHCFICRPSDSTVSEDAGIEPSTRYWRLPHWQSDALTTRLDLTLYVLQPELLQGYIEIV
jgi:hypothetical protein